jgi:hypothetical protein
MSADELAFFKANLEDLSQTFLRQLKRDVIAEKKRRRGAEASANGNGRANNPLASPVSANPALLGGGGGYALPKGTRSHRGQAQRKRVGFFQLGRFDGTCRKASSTQATVRSWARASVCTGKKNLRYHGRSVRRGSGRATGKRGECWGGFLDNAPH